MNIRKNINHLPLPTTFLYLICTISSSALYAENINPDDDFDGDGVINSLDIDDDNDGVLDINELVCETFNEYVPADPATDPISGRLGALGTYTTIGGKPAARRTYRGTGGTPGDYIALGKNDSLTLAFFPSVRNIRIIISDFESENLFIRAYDMDNNLIEDITPYKTESGANLTVSDTDNIIGQSLYIRGNTTVSVDGDAVKGSIVLDFPFELSKMDFESDHSERGSVVIAANGGCAQGDTDADGLSDQYDLDSDSDGISDNIEAQSPETYVPPEAVWADADSDGLHDQYDDDDANVDSIASRGLLPTDTDVTVTTTNTDGAATDEAVAGTDATVTDSSSSTDVAGTDSGSDTVNTAVEVPTGTEATVTDNGVDSAGVSLQLRVLLQGPYDSSVGLMSDDLRRKDLLPVNQPYTTAPFDYDGMEQLSANLKAVEGDDAVVDWVLVELRDATDVSSILAAKAMLVQRDGDVVTEAGETSWTPTDVVGGNYFVALRHRNHLDLLTATAVALSSELSLIDFSASSQAVAGNAGRMKYEGLALMIAGDATQDQRDIAHGPDQDTNKLLSDVLAFEFNHDSNANYIFSGYENSDLNMDGNTIFAGPENDSNVLLGNILLHESNNTFSANYIINGSMSSNGGMESITLE